MAAAMVASFFCVEASLVDSVKNFFSGNHPAPSPMIQVLLIHDQPAVMLEVKGKYKILDPNTRAVLSSRVVGKKKLIQSLSGGLKWGEEFPGIYQLQLVPDSQGASINVEGVEYPGSITIYDVGGTLSVVNQVNLETYLNRVLSYQYPDKLPEETMAAIAIASRAQAFWAVKHPKNSFWDVDGQQVGYKGGTTKELPIELESAIKNTRNMILSAKSSQEEGSSPVCCQWGPGVGGREAGVVYSRVTLFDAEEMGKKGKDAAEILSRAFPNSQIELIQ
jgi:stage II sporulation protein D